MTTMKTTIPLLELCEKATKGPWMPEGNMIFCDRMGGLLARTYDNCETGSDKNSSNNAQLIARLSPEVVKAVYEALAWAYNAAPEQSGLEMEAKRALALLDGTTAPSDLT